MSGYTERLGTFVRTLKQRNDFRDRERWPRERIEAWQHQRIAQIVQHATKHSAYFRKLYGGEVQLRSDQFQRLPVTTKEQMMAQFDEYVTVPELRLEQLSAHLERVHDDDLFAGRFRVMGSSGSTGGRSVHVFDRDEWLACTGSNLRYTEYIGVRPRWPNRVRIATIGAPDAKHMTFRAARSVEVGMFNVLRLSATQPVAEMVTQLNVHRPEFITSYPSVLALLAQEQVAGRLQINPRAVSTSSELRTEEMTQAIRSAWRIEPHNCLGLTETGTSAVDCEQHAGLHVFEDLCVFEAVDEHNQPVPNGTVGAKLLVTSLYRRVQPIIRMEVSDQVSITNALCACGRTFHRVEVLAGRADDILRFPATSGGCVAVHPIHLRSSLAAISAIRQYQIVHGSFGLRIRAVFDRQADARALSQLIASRLRTTLAGQGATEVPIQIEIVEQIEREAGPGKFKLVKAA